MKKPNIQYVAVKAIIINKDGKVLVLKQHDPTITGHNRYHPPGGIIELGESVNECVIREVREELGVECEVEKLFDIGEWLARRGEDVMQFIGLFYICHIKNEGFKLQATEASEVAWVGKQDIEDVDIIEPSKSIIEKFLNLNN